MLDSQPSLFDLFAPVVTPEYESGATIGERFEAFHGRNPHIYAELRRMALALRQRGMARYGIAGLFETLRYHYAIQTQGDDFKLNNDFRALYARLLMRNEPALYGFFEIRCRRTE